MPDKYSSLAPFAQGGAAVITRGASGIGLSAARRFLDLGLGVAIADLPGERLDAARAELSTLGDAIALGIDVAKFSDLERLRDEVLQRFSHVAVLMNNAGAGERGVGNWNDMERFKRTIEVNFYGVLHGVHAFMPAMLAVGQPAFIINTGSKQGITTPPGNPAYNVSKAALKAYTEGLQHELRNTPGCQISAHLLVPGFTYTGMAARYFAEQPRSSPADRPP